ANAILRETGHAVTPEEAGRLLRLHAEAYARLAGTIRPLPGARELLAYLSEAGVPWAIATSGRIESARPTLEALGVPAGVPVVTGSGRGPRARCAHPGLYPSALRASPAWSPGGDPNKAPGDQREPGGPRPGPAGLRMPQGVPRNRAAIGAPGRPLPQGQPFKG